MFYDFVTIVPPVPRKFSESSVKRNEPELGSAQGWTRVTFCRSDPTHPVLDSTRLDHPEFTKSRPDLTHQSFQYLFYAINS
jgi:hypothetical protein